MGQFANHPDYRLRWPADVFKDALGELATRGLNEGTSPAWREDVELLLRQAFGSDVPIDDFRKVTEKPKPGPSYDVDEEPF